MSTLKELRNQKNLTQKELSNITGISIKTIQAYEQNYLSLEYASIINISKLCKALSCHYYNLVSIEL